MTQNPGSLNDMPGVPQDAFSFHRRAAKESRDRHTSETNEIWGPVWDKRKCFVGVGYGRFHLELNQGTEVILLSDTYGFVAHRMVVGWLTSKRKGTSFPNRELVRCRAWKVNPDGTWIQTGKQCPICHFLGSDPRYVVLWALLDKRAESIVDPQSNRSYTRAWNLKYLAADTDTIRSPIWDGAAVACHQYGAKPTTRFARFMVTRGNDPQSNGYGNSWVIIGFADPNYAEIQSALAALPPWEVTWPEFSAQQMVEMCKVYKKVKDEHPTIKETYSAEGAVRVFGPSAAPGGQGSVPTLVGAGGVPTQHGGAPSLSSLQDKVPGAPGAPGMAETPQTGPGPSLGAGPSLQGLPAGPGPSPEPAPGSQPPSAAPGQAPSLGSLSGSTISTQEGLTGQPTTVPVDLPNRPTLSDLRDMDGAQPPQGQPPAQGQPQGQTTPAKSDEDDDWNPWPEDNL